MKKPAHPKKTKQETAKPTIRLGKEDFQSPSPIAQHMQTSGVNKTQKKELEHSVGPKRKKAPKK